MSIPDGVYGVSLDLTTHCDRRCPECCCAIGLGRKLQHHPWEYFERAAQVLHGVSRVDLCGGEPTLHPQFGEFIPKLKALFGCQTLGMVTDGWGVIRHFDVIKANVDVIHYSYYHTNPGAKAAIEHLMPDIKLSVYDAGLDAADFTPRSRRGPGGPCGRHWQRSGQIAYADGRIFGCCVAPGIDGAVGVLPIIGQDFEIPEPPCGNCWWSE